MSEYCLLENNSEIEGNGRDLTMKSALYNSRVIFADLAIGNAASWQWWVAISPYDYKDGLIYTDHSKYDGNIYDSKMLWAMGNFSRFIKAGMKRVSVSRSDMKTDEQSLDNTMACAFVSDDKKKATMVIVNYRESTIPVKFTLNNLPNASGFKMYLTDGKNENNITYKKELNQGDVIDIPPRSVVTFTNQP